MDSDAKIASATSTGERVFIGLLLTG
jgi:hypothetical protein